MLLLSTKRKLLLLQMFAMSKFSFATIALETLPVCRTVDTKILQIPCVLHLAAIFTIFYNKPSVPVVFNKLIIPA